MKFAAWKLGFRIQEVPITFSDRTEGSSKMSSGIFNEAMAGVLKMRFSGSASYYRKK
jgi:dolichol-phosphate mannosyltransferase